MSHFLSRAALLLRFADNELTAQLSQADRDTADCIRAVQQRVYAVTRDIDSACRANQHLTRRTSKVQR